MATNVRAGVMLSLGLVGCRVDVQGSIDSDKDTEFNNVCCGAAKAHDPSGVNMKLVCPVCGNDDKDTFKKGRVTRDSVTLIDLEALQKAAGVDKSMTERMELTVHPAAEVYAAHMIPTGAPYWLVPNTVAEHKTYNAIVRALEEAPELAVFCEWAPRTKITLYQLMVIDTTLALQKVAYPAAVRTRPTVDIDPGEKVIGQMIQLMNNGVVDFDPENYTDTRKAALLALVEGGETVALADVEAPAAVSGLSLEDKLEAALAASAKAKPVKGATAKAKPVKGAQAKKTTTRKAPVKAS